MDTYVHLDIFKGLTPTDTAQLLTLTQEVSFAAGDLIIRDSDVACDLYILTHGWVSIEMDATEPDSQGRIEVAVLGTGETFGEITFLAGIRRSADVRAITAVSALKWDGPRLHQLLEEDHELGYHFMKNLARILAQRIRDINLRRHGT